MITFYLCIHLWPKIDIFPQKQHTILYELQSKCHIYSVIKRAGVTGVEVRSFCFVWLKFRETTATINVNIEAHNVSAIVTFSSTINNNNKLEDLWILFNLQKNIWYIIIV